MTSTMSSRERIMAAIRGEDVDRLPWSPCLDGYFLGPQMDQLEAFRRIRADAMIRNVTNFTGSLPMANSVPPPGKSHPYTQSTQIVDGEFEMTYETPVGTITERFMMNEESPNIPWFTKHKVENVEDLKILQWICERAQFEPQSGAFEKMDEKVGDDGIATLSVLGCPLFNMLNLQCTVQNFWYLYADHTQAVEEYLETAHQMTLRMFHAIAQGPGHVVIQYENLSSSLCSPQLWEMYCLDRVNEYADILHDAGKIFLQHNCGHLAAFGPKIAELRVDGICDFATPPTGTITFAAARENWGPEILIMGGIDATHYAGDTPKEIKDYVRTLIADMGDGRRIILGSGDATPKNTPWENLVAVTEIIEQEGAFALNQ